jgi:hypothetical protein
MVAVLPDQGAACCLVAARVALCVVHKQVGPVACIATVKLHTYLGNTQNDGEFK